MAPSAAWEGVFPAVTTQFRSDFSLDIDATRQIMDRLIRDGARPDLVQCIKLCEHLVGRGSDLTRPPRLPLAGLERDAIEALVKKAIATRPQLPDVGLRAA